MCRYMHYMASLVLLGKQDVIELAFSINLDTMTCEPAAAASHQAAQAATLVPLLDLSEQQQELIAAGTTLYYDLLQPIHLQRHRVHEELAAVEKEYDVQRDGGGECTSADGHDDGDGDAKPGAVDPGSSSSGSNSGKLERLSSRQALLHKQQELTSRLSLLLHKEYCVRLTGMGWFIGCLSYTQLSKLAVMCWPYGMRVLFLATEIMRHREHVNKQRLQLCS